MMASGSRRSWREQRRWCAVGNPVVCFETSEGRKARIRASDLTGIYPRIHEGDVVWDVHCRLLGPVATVSDAQGVKISNYLMETRDGDNEGLYG